MCKMSKWAHDNGPVFNETEQKKQKKQKTKKKKRNEMGYIVTMEGVKVKS